MMATRSRGAGVALAAVALLLLAGCSTAPSERSLGQSSVGVDARKNVVEWQDASLSIEDLVPTPAPTSISIAGIVSNMPVEAHGLASDGQMSLPESPFVAAWYQFGPAPANGQGNTVIAAHVDDRIEGIGPFAQLRSAQPGTSVTIVDSEGVSHTYAIVSVEKLSKQVVEWEQYFTTDGPDQLILVTCGGQFVDEIRNYTDNYIVTAERVS